MRTVLASLMLLAASSAGAPAQPAKPPVESVTVTGLKDAPQLAVNHFVQAFAAPSYLTGKMARWENGVCPVTKGLAPKFAAFVSQRVRTLAAQVNAPVEKSASCRANIEIVFTTTPQALLDNVRKKHQIYLGYHSGSDQADRLALVTRPIQAWYLTATKDLAGHVEVDSFYSMPTEPVANIIMDVGMGGVGHAGERRVTGGRIKDGLRTVLHHVIIAADPTKLTDYEVGTLADYVAILALTQLNSLDVCQQQLPSIINLLARDCAGAPHQLSESDLGYLKGLYSMSADGNMRMQQDDIAHRMKQTFRGQ